MHLESKVECLIKLRVLHCSHGSKIRGSPLYRNVSSCCCAGDDGAGVHGERRSEELPAHQTTRVSIIISSFYGVV